MELIRHPAHARAFLDRARRHLAAFDETREAAGVFYAALELRFGIEARLYDYLRATLQKLGRAEPTGYEGKKLLAALRRAAPESEHATAIGFRDEAEPSRAGGMHYTPVTRELASDHGKLGGLLHYEYFARSRQGWMIPVETEGEPQTLIDWAGYLHEVAGRLEGACRGTLLAHPSFVVLLDLITE